MAALDLSIIIVNYNAGPFLSRNLSSIKKFLANLPHEVIVVDNASSDASVQLLKEHFPEVRLIENKRNLGFAAAVNQGIRQSIGEFVLWLNPDSELLDANLSQVIQYLRIHPQTGIAGIKILNSDHTLQLSCRSFPSHATAFFNRYSLLTRLFPSNPVSRQYLNSGWQHDEIRTVDWVSGACLLHRKKTAEEIGLLDETFFMYCEDVDFCLRAKKNGWKTVYHPAAAVLHHIAGSSKHAPRRMIVERHKSMWHYYLKHFPRNVFLDAATFCGIFMRCAWQVLLNPRHTK